MQDNRNSTNYWMSELKSIPFPGIRNFINYKLEQLKDLGSEIEIFISSELEKIDTATFSEKEYNELTTILGVILDNMIESIKETDERWIYVKFLDTFFGKMCSTVFKFIPIPLFVMGPQQSFIT